MATSRNRFSSTVTCSLPLSFLRSTKRVILCTVIALPTVHYKILGLVSKYDIKSNTTHLSVKTAPPLSDQLYSRFYFVAVLCLLFVYSPASVAY